MGDLLRSQKPQDIVGVQEGTRSGGQAKDGKDRTSSSCDCGGGASGKVKPDRPRKRENEGLRLKEANEWPRLTRAVAGFRPPTVTSSLHGQYEYKAKAPGGQKGNRGTPCRRQRGKCAESRNYSDKVSEARLQLLNS